MEKNIKKIKNIPESSWFKGHSQEENKSEMYLIYPFTRAGLVLYGLAHKMKEFDMNNWRYFARLNLLLIFYDLNKRYSNMGQRTSNEFKLKYGFDFLFWSILASHYIPYRFIQFSTYTYFNILNKRFNGSKMLYIGFIPVMMLNYIAYPIFYKIGDKIGDLVMNSTYRIFIANYLKCKKFITF